MGTFELIAAGKFDPSQINSVKMGRESADFLLNVVDNMLDMTKLEDGRIKIGSSDFSIDDLVEKVVGLLSAKAEASGIALSVGRDPALPRWLRDDPDRLRQILLNLVGNAIKFTQAGKVTIGLGRPQGSLDRVRIEIPIPASVSRPMR